MEIICSAPYIEIYGGQSRLCCEVSFPDSTKQVMWYGVSNEYAKYLTADRCDAFVTPLIPYAMRSGCDIRCKAPVSRKLMYQVNQYLISAYVLNLPSMHPCKIIAVPAQPIKENAGGVATGWTGGVDTLYTVMHNINSPEPEHKLTHLFILNCGTLEGDKLSEKLQFLVAHAQSTISKDTGLSIVGVDSNVHEVLKETFIAVSTFRIGGVALALQKLLKTYLFSSANDYSVFKFNKEATSQSDLFTVQMLRTESTTIYSAHRHTRPEKLRELSEYPLAYRYLHPCVMSIHKPNCMLCRKCRNTLNALYALGTLDRFTNTFDVQFYYDHLLDYLSDTFSRAAATPVCNEIQKYLYRNPSISPEILYSAKAKTYHMIAKYRALNFISANGANLPKKTRDSLSNHDIFLLSLSESNNIHHDA